MDFSQAFHTTSKEWAELFIAFSAFGYLISTVYAYSRCGINLYFIPSLPLLISTLMIIVYITKSMHANRISDIVNQKIFRQRFFPFYQLCDRDHPYYKTPTGGLIVQWFWTVLNIAIAPNSPGGYGFIINVKSYGHIALTCMYLQFS